MIIINYFRTELNSFLNKHLLEYILCLQDDHYSNKNVNSLIAKISNKRDEPFKCRTIGILESKNGHYYLKEMDTNTKDQKHKVRISTTYLKKPLPSLVMPNTVQLFGSVQWVDQPVFYINIVQMLTPQIAIRMSNAVNEIRKKHVARRNIEINE
ncbi:unnamed protein product [Leptidea sinapis]|uniref:Uncharacterized protein n=1 Tax=Leptidea sinapis TaxID=189913 RepID=A0A5E4PPJ4_9NEOP|nr:unnamed protein product [Leptidea sinapis]